MSRTAATPAASPPRSTTAQEPTWLLVTGAPRSGTSLLRALLTEHPGIGLLQEYGLTDLIRRIDAIVARDPPATEDWDSPGDPDDDRFNAATRFYRDRPGRSAVTRGGGDPKPEHFAAVAAGLFGGMFPGRDLRIVGDKMPIGAAWEDIPLLFERLHGFRILTVVRNPTDTVRSSLVRREATRRGRDAWPIRTVEAAIAQWTVGWHTLLFLKARYGSAVLAIKYEDLCANPQEIVDEVHAWLGLPPHPVSTPISALPPDLALHSPDEQTSVEACLGPIIAAWPDHTVETLMATFSTLATPLASGKPIDLASEEADPFLVAGFSFREEWGRWTDGPCAEISVPHGLSRGLLLVDIRVHQAFSRNGAPCDVVVRSGWGEPRLFQLEPAHSRIAFVVQAEEADDRGRLRIQLLVARPKQPDEAPQDGRALGVLIRSITISLLPDGLAEPIAHAGSGR